MAGICRPDRSGIDRPGAGIRTGMATHLPPQGCQADGHRLISVLADPGVPVLQTQMTEAGGHDSGSTRRDLRDAQMAQSRWSPEVPGVPRGPRAPGGDGHPDPAGESCEDTGVRPGRGGSASGDPEDPL